jgi:hypothetical protein
MSMDMNVEITEQNDRLKQLNINVDKQQNNITINNREINKLLHNK